jgi:hypothetical protein
MFSRFLASFFEAPLTILQADHGRQSSLSLNEETRERGNLIDKFINKGPVFLVPCLPS